MFNYNPPPVNTFFLFERSLSKLSENHKNVDIGSTVLQLWPLKYVVLHLALPLCLIIGGLFQLP